MLLKICYLAAESIALAQFIRCRFWSAAPMAFAWFVASCLLSVSAALPHGREWIARVWTGMEPAVLLFLAVAVAELVLLQTKGGRALRWASLCAFAFVVLMVAAPLPKPALAAFVAVRRWWKLALWFVMIADALLPLDQPAWLRRHSWALLAVLTDAAWVNLWPPPEGWWRTFNAIYSIGMMLCFLWWAFGVSPLVQRAAATPDR